MKKLATIASLVLGLTVALAGKAAAQNYGPPPAGGYAPTPVGYYVPPHEHNGFFARGYLGPAYISSSVDTGGGKLTVHGGGALLGLAAGAAVTPQIIVYGELFGDVAVGPTAELGDSSVTASDNTSFGVAGLGAGVAYYTPQNFFVSGTLSFSQLSEDDDTTDNVDPATTDFGPGVTLLGGKEWWVAGNTAVGVAGQFFFGTEPEKNDGPTWHTTAFGVAVTVSYN